ncbi:MAG: ABC transporter ATP-binding protein, partial [Bacteroidota bacterium]
MRDSLSLTNTMSEPPQKKIFDVSLLVRVFRFVKPYRSLFYVSLILAMLMAAFAPVRPYLIQLTLDAATGRAVLLPGWLKAVLFGTDLSDTTKFIIAVSLFQVIFLLVETTIRFLFTFITASMGQSVVKDMRNTVYSKILSLNLS